MAARDQQLFSFMHREHHHKAVSKAIILAAYVDLGPQIKRIVAGMNHSQLATTSLMFGRCGYSRLLEVKSGLDVMMPRCNPNGLGG